MSDLVSSAGVAGGSSVLFAKLEAIMAHLEELKAEVAANREVTASAILLLDGLAEKIEHHKNDPVELQKLADDLRDDREGLGAAVARNTPTDPDPIDPDPVDPEDPFDPEV
jgi:hypothetical protein